MGAGLTLRAARSNPMTPDNGTIRSNSAAALRGALFLLCALGVPAAAQETVTVEKVRGLAGAWRIAVPRSIQVTLFSGTHFGAMRSIFCRIGEVGNIHCLNGGFSREGSVSLDGQAVHIAWGTAMARFVIDGTSDGQTIAGRFALKLSGIAHPAPTPSSGRRIAMAGAPMTKMPAPLTAALPPALQALGPMEAVFHLGASPKLDGGGDADYFQVYAVEFAAGERVCGVHADSITCI